MSARQKRSLSPSVTSHRLATTAGERAFGLGLVLVELLHELLALATGKAPSSALSRNPSSIQYVLANLSLALEAIQARAQSAVRV